MTTDNVANTPRGHVLVIDDEQDARELLALTLERDGYRVTPMESPAEALELLATEDVDVVLTDLVMPEMHGFALCERIRGVRPDVPILVVTGEATLPAAVDAMRVGVFDFIVKPIDPALLGVSVARACAERRLIGELRVLKSRIDDPTAEEGKIIGDSSALRSVRALVRRVADTEATVLIQGETGTGKELVARSVHALSRRRSGPFVAVNCAAITPTLLESELFGHTRGAFTDAKEARTGLFVQANGGTLFLDEIGELPLDMQPKLLRAVQERRVRPVGSDHELPVDVRIVAATHRVLEDLVAEGAFREDLYYRLGVVRIDVPALRERPGDILRLSVRFLEQFAAAAGRPAPRLSKEATDKLVAYPWNGNVRELENCMEHVMAMGRGEQVELDDLPQKISSYRQERFVVAPAGEEEIVTVDELQSRYLRRVLDLVGGNKSRAASLLGIDRRTLYRQLGREAAAVPAPRAADKH
jgi:DNA-binding NtrC family response regulator